MQAQNTSSLAKYSLRISVVPSRNMACAVHLSCGYLMEWNMENTEELCVSLTAVSNLYTLSITWLDRA